MSWIPGTLQSSWSPFTLFCACVRVYVCDWSVVFVFDCCSLRCCVLKEKTICMGVQWWYFHSNNIRIRKHDMLKLFLYSMVGFFAQVKFVVTLEGVSSIDHVMNVEPEKSQWRCEFMWCAIYCKTALSFGICMLWLFFIRQSSGQFRTTSRVFAIIASILCKRQLYILDTTAVWGTNDDIESSSSLTADAIICQRGLKHNEWKGTE